MKESKFTPGKWRAQSRSLSDGSLVIKSDGPEFREICCIREGSERSYGPQDDEDQANAVLLESAPDLLAALESAAKQFDYTVSSMEQGHSVSMSSLQNCAAQARATIAKAKDQS